MEFAFKDMMRLQTVCATKGEANPVVYPHSCCSEKTRLIDESVNSNWLDQDGVEPEYEVSLSTAADLLEELAESMFSVLGTTCSSRQMGVI